MMKPFGWKTIEYSNGVSASDATFHVPILSANELRVLSRRLTQSEDYSADVNNEPLCAEFTRRVIMELKKRVSDGDIICHVFGPIPEIAAATPKCFQVETGIGYMCTDGAMPYRIYESAVWMHWHYGRRNKSWGHNYEFVVPNYYDLNEWPVVLSPQPKDNEPYIVVFGRLIESKGLSIVVEIATRMPSLKFILCGQGDPEPWVTQSSNLISMAPLQGDSRAPLLGNALAILAPTSFIEPFCGSAVEAQLCGTPVVSSNFGAFWETVIDGVTGYRCNSLADYIGAIRRAPKLNRSVIAERARRLYSLETVGATYNIVLNNIAQQSKLGWYSGLSNLFDSVEF